MLVVVTNISSVERGGSQPGEGLHLLLPDIVDYEGDFRSDAEHSVVLMLATSMVATAASTALPPFSSSSIPAATAFGFSATTAPPFPEAYQPEASAPGRADDASKGNTSRNRRNQWARFKIVFMSATTRRGTGVRPAF